MIRFCDVEEYVVHIGEMSRMEMIMFFLGNSDGGNTRSHLDSVITVLDEEEHYYGIVTYSRVLAAKNEKECILRDIMPVSDSFFENVNKWFEAHPEEQLLPVINDSGERLGFCYNDNNERYIRIFDYITTLEKAQYIPVSFFEWENCQQICIMDCNELAVRCYYLFKKLGYSVCVIGEKWEWFGIKGFEGYMDVPENRKIYIYMEGNGWTRWKWVNNKKPQYVGQYIDNILGFWIGKNQMYCYEYVMKKWREANISVCKCRLPERDEIEYWTKLELEALFYGTGLNKGIINKANLPIKQINLLKKIMGEDAVEMFSKTEEVDRNGWKRIDYNEVVSEKLESSAGKYRIYLIGPCIVSGVGKRTEKTLLACLQKFVEKSGYIVVKVPITPSNLFFWFSERESERIPIREKDIIIVVERSYMLQNCEGIEINLSNTFNDINRKTWLPDDNSLHVNDEGVYVIAKTMYNKYIKNEIERLSAVVKGNKFVQQGDILSDKLKSGIHDYVEKILRISKQYLERNVQGKGTIGSIVMNANPFTYGHEYLITYAANKVDVLYLFVVEEDCSLFSFKQRMRMVKEGTGHLLNVCVVPSSEWVLSYQTFPVYFGKSEKQEEKVDARIDLEIFARYIAPALGIQYRFAGEEPCDKITRQYNEQMEEILEDFGISFVEVPRKEINGQVVSASLVRKYVQEEKWDEVRKYVPETTYVMLRETE